MNPNLTILLVEDNKTACEDIAHYIETQDTVDLIGITNNSVEAISLVEVLLPDAVILNLELHHGGGNGIHFLNELNRLTLPFRPYILITTNNCSDVTYEIVRSLGADFIMYKQEAFYSASYVVTFLQTIHSVLLSARKTQLPCSCRQDSSAIQTQKTIQRISKELDLVGISRKSIGFPYLTDAILLTMEHPECNIFTSIAKKYRKSDGSVEHAMRHAINRAWLSFPIEDIEKNYTAKVHSGRGAPTTLEFVYYYADKIKNNTGNVRR